MAFSKLRLEEKWQGQEKTKGSNVERWDTPGRNAQTGERVITLLSFNDDLGAGIKGSIFLLRPTESL